MNKQKQTLDKSIEKWKGVVKGEIERGNQDCACCQEYYLCKGCPVANYTGGTACHSTPYGAWVDEFFPGLIHKAVTERQVALAQDELDFLIEVRRNLDE